jgi:hypothetical protein
VGGEFGRKKGGAGMRRIQSKVGSLVSMAVCFTTSSPINAQDCAYPENQGVGGLRLFSRYCHLL